MAANIIFAASFSFIKIITPQYIAPFGLNVARVGVTVILFWILFALKPSNAAINRKDWGRFIICALAGVAINQVLFVKGISLTSSIHASLLMLASPIFITLIAAWLLKERLGKKTVAGMLLGISGAAFLILMRQEMKTATDPVLGDLLIMMNAISYAFYMVLVRPLMAAYSPIHVLRWVFTIGMFFILPIGWNQFVAVDWAAIPPIGWFSLAFVIIGATFLAYLFSIYALQHLGAAVTGNYIYTQPFFAAVIAMVFLGEDFTIQKGIAGMLIFTGVFLVNYKRNANRSVAGLRVVEKP
nr:DMT family transporter [Aridibaculum aurantiacum]